MRAPLTYRCEAGRLEATNGEDRLALDERRAPSIDESGYQFTAFVRATNELAALLFIEHAVREWREFLIAGATMQNRVPRG